MTEWTQSSLIRAYVDSELDAERAAALERRLDAEPALRASVEAERLLRARVGEVMRSAVPEAPPEVAAAVRAAMSEASDMTDACEPAPARRAWMIGPQRANRLAVAAVLILIAGVVIVSMLVPPIDRWGQIATERDLVDDRAEFVVGEHGRCAMDPAHRSGKAALRSPEEARRWITSNLGCTGIEIVDLRSNGYEFVGAGACCVPGTKLSAHVVYRRPSPPDERSPMVSLFVVPYDAASSGAITVGTWERLDAPSGCARSVHRLSTGELVYFLVCCDEGDVPAVSRTVARGLGCR